jgi:hypothetical protein
MTASIETSDVVERCDVLVLSVLVQEREILLALLSLELKLKPP